jgi:alcohol dehydrogenase (cytochrome c)
LVYVPSVEMCGTFYRDTIEIGPIGGYFRPDSSRTGWLNAIDAQTGALRWRYRSSAPMLASVVVVKDLVITGEMRGDVIVFDAVTGRVLERHRIGPQVGAGMVAYEIDGRQYIAALSGSVSYMLPLAHWGEPHVAIFEVTRRAPQ